MTKLAPAIDSVDRWYNSTLTPEQQRKWKHPLTVMKHFPHKHLLKPTGAPLANKNRGGRPKKAKGANPETMSLLRKLISVLNAFLAGTLTRERAHALLAELGEGGPNDSLEGSVAFGDTEADDELDDEEAEAED
jgi:hypothetical protein